MRKARRTGRINPNSNTAGVIGHDADGNEVFDFDLDPSLLLDEHPSDPWAPRVPVVRDPELQRYLLQNTF